MNVAEFPNTTSYSDLWAIHEPSIANLLQRIDTHFIQSRMAFGVDQPTGSGFSTTPGGTAIIQIWGITLKQESCLFCSTSTVFARRQIRAAVRNDAVKAILLHVDSPGGTVAGINDLADDIFAARQRKPTVAFIEDLGASAAYWAASQAGQVFMNPSGSAGGIGTYAVVVDASRAAKTEGVKVHVIKAGKFKGAGTFGTEITDEQLEMFQERVDQLNEFFIQSVARGRGMSLNRVRELADGRVHIGQAAVKLGLVDGLKSLDEVVDLHEGKINRDVQPAPRAQAVSSYSPPPPIQEVARTTTQTAISEFTGLVKMKLQDGMTQQGATRYIRTIVPGLYQRYAREVNQYQSKEEVPKVLTQTKTKPATREWNQQIEARQEAGLNRQQAVPQSAVAAEWGEAVQAELDRGKNRQAAVRAVVHKNPDLHQRYVDAAQSQPRRE